MSTKGLPLKLRISINLALVWDRLVTSWREVDYNSSYSKMKREWAREERKRDAFLSTMHTNHDILRKDDSYSDWYDEMNKIRQARRKARHPMNRGIFA